MSETNGQQPITDNKVDQKLVGIRGWLIFPSIALVVGPTGEMFLVLFSLWALGTMMNSNYVTYTTLEVIAVGIEGVIRIAILFYAFVAGLRFFKKSRNAPQTVIRLIVVSLVVRALLFILSAVLFESVDIPTLVIGLVVPGIVSPIWILYFRVSKRVKATFVNQEDIFGLPYKVVLPIRYLLRRPITYFAVLAVALCVFIVVIVMTVMTGLVDDFKQKNHDFVGDCVVGSESLVGFAYYEDFVKELEGAESVEAVSEVIKGYALLSPRGRDVNRGVEIMGIDPVRHSRATGFASTLYYRKDDVSRAFEPSYDPNLPGCVLGIDIPLQRDANSHYSYQASPSRVGFALTFFPLTARGALAGAGAGLVNTKTFYYSDLSQSGLARVDSSLVYLPFNEAQLLCGMAGPVKRVNAVHIKFKPTVGLKAGCDAAAALWNRFKEQKAGENQAYLLDTVAVQSWKSHRRMLIAAMEKEQTMMTVMFGFVGIVTVFIVLVVFYMLISHKSKDIGVLRSIGASTADIIGLFCGFAFLVGLIGSLIGLSGGWLFLLRINRLEDWLFEHFGYQVWDRTMFAIGDIPSQVSPRVLAVIVFSAIAACLLGALVPSWQAIRLKPVETLQVNQL